MRYSFDSGKHGVYYHEYWIFSIVDLILVHYYFVADCFVSSGEDVAADEDPEVDDMSDLYPGLRQFVFGFALLYVIVLLTSLNNNTFYSQTQASKIECVANTRLCRVVECRVAACSLIHSN